MEQDHREQLEKAERKGQVLDCLIDLQDACFIAESQVNKNVDHLTTIAHQASPFEQEKTRYLSYWIERYGSVYSDIEKIHAFVRDENRCLLDPEYEPWETASEDITQIRNSILLKAMAAHNEVHNGLRS